MNKRLNEMLELLKGKDVMSKAQIAEILEVSSRTIQRYSKILIKKGEPLVWKSGRGGGYMYIK